MITLYRIDPDANMARFYHCRIERTLFGQWAVVRQWGRIGHLQGRSRADWYDTRSLAEHAMDRLITQKQRRGYRSYETPGALGP